MGHVGTKDHTAVTVHAFFDTIWELSGCQNASPVMIIYSVSSYRSE